MTQTAMISGHLDLTQEEFDEYYAPVLLMAIRNGDSFLVGDARGADVMAQAYIFKRLTIFDYRLRLTVYHMFEKPRNHLGHCPTKGRYTKDHGKDAAMTADSDYDILYIRPNKHSSVSGRVSGTEANMIRRKAKEMSK